MTKGPVAIGTIDDADRARFWLFVDKDGPVMRPELGPCWVWKGHRDEDGYGTFSINGKPRRANRVAWAIAHGEPGEAHVCHRCDNPACVRAEHLFNGTNTENTADRHRKGRTARGPEMHRNRRHATGDRNWAHTHPERFGGENHYAHYAPEKILRGEKHGGAILTEAQAIEIKRRAAAGERKADLADEFGVTIYAVYDLCSGRSWKHLNTKDATP